MEALYALLHILITNSAYGTVQRNSDCNDGDISVVSFVNPDPEIGSFKKVLNDVPSLAVLANDPRAALPNSFTICSTIQSVLSTKPNHLMFFNLIGRDGERALPAVLFGNDFWTTQKASGMIPTVFPNQWVRSCMAVNSTSGIVQWVVNGNLVDNSTNDIFKDSKISAKLSHNLILGAYQLPSKSWQVYSNKVTNINVFTNMLSVPIMQIMTKEGHFCGEGDYLAWSDMDWDLRGGAIIEKIGAEELETNPPVNLYTAGFQNRDTCKYFCENLGGQMPYLSNKSTFGKLQGFCERKMNERQQTTWLAVDDVQEEGIWRDSYTGQSLNFTPPWVGNEPNGGKGENCAVVGVNCNWGDMPCTKSAGYNCLCENHPNPNLKLLGLCKESVIDHSFQPQNDAKDIERLTLVGHSTSIEYDGKLWVMNVFHYNVTGTSRASHASFTLGKNEWTIFGDTGCNKEGNFHKADLKMSGCKEDQFTCYNGQCVSMEERCNQVPDCRDRSDERNCVILVLEEGYNMRVPPVEKDAMRKITPVAVNVSLTLLKVVAIEEEDHSIELQIQITLEWNEIRATYQNLKPEIYLNALSYDEISSLWLPLVIYMNTDQQESTRFANDWEWSTYVSVKRMGNFTRGTYNTDEAEIFKGEENTLVMTQSYTHEFQCVYDLGRYPFDTQECSIEMNVLSHDQKSVMLIPSLLTMNQTLDMTLFVITDFVLENATSAKGGIRMAITMKRKILSEMMTTYFPSLLLMMITYATTFFKPFFFEAALSVNLTTMLVMTTIFISKMESLPPTSDIKMIDCWLILCQLVPFVEVVLLTAIDYLRDEAKEKQKRKKRAERKRNKEGKRKANKQEKQEKDGHTSQPAKSRNGRDLDITIEKQGDTEQVEPIKAWTLDQPYWIKFGLVTKLVVVEKKVVPLAVLLAFFIYCGVAAIFHFL